MAYTVLKLLTNAYYEAEIVARSFETLTPEETSDGLFYLNQVLGLVDLDSGIIPFYIQYEFDMEQGVQTYFIPNLVDVDTVVFFKDQVRYSVANMKRRDYWGSPRTEGIETLPVYYTVDRVLGGSNISFYFFPDQAYPVQIWAAFGLDSVSNPLLDLSLTYPRYYLDFLRYTLAVTLCAAFGYPVPDELRRQHAKYDRSVRKRSGYIDLQATVLSTISAATSLNYGQVNIGRGFTTLSRSP